MVCFLLVSRLLTSLRGVSDVVIEDDRVSKQHFRIYPIIYDKETRPDEPPLIYCEDLQSFNGTFVNDVLIGNIYSEKVGHLLSDGDVVEIRPHWKFRFHQPIHQSIGLDKSLTHELKVQALSWLLTLLLTHS